MPFRILQVSPVDPSNAAASRAQVKFSVISKMVVASALNVKAPA
jgi:hypothetical protein